MLMPVTQIPDGYGTPVTTNKIETTELEAPPTAGRDIRNVVIHFEDRAFE